MHSVSTRAGTGLRPVEIADAGVFAALAVVIVSIGAFLPHLGVIELLSVVPFALVGLRHRIRAVVAAMIAAGFTAFLVAGVTATAVVVSCAVLGGLCGAVRRWGRGTGTITLAAAALAPLTAATVVGALYVFSATRGLVFASLSASLVGIGRIFGRAFGLTQLQHRADAVSDAVLGAWPVTVSALILLIVPIAMLAANAAVVLVARRVEWLGHSDLLEYALHADDAMAAQPIAPLPLEFEGVGYRHQGGHGPVALIDIDLTIMPGEFVAVVGANGAGKSTLVSLLAGAEPTSGRVRRPGRVGLGLPGGTAIVAQRAETQVIGSTVAEDLRWGLPAGYDIDVEQLLSCVGLTGLAAASTESLSGGQLQRLAIAAALARCPALLVSDESTAMLDAAGRAEVMDLLADLPDRTGTAVVHVTHDPAEAARAKRVISLADGRIDEATGLAATLATGTPAPVTTHAAVADPAVEPVIRLRAVGHRFDAGTPWEATALRSVDLDIRDGEGVLITGANGSGKTTLAWVLAGLIHPTQGTAFIAGAPASESVGAVAVSFQHARLQLQRPTVAEDLLAAAGLDEPLSSERATALVNAALTRVGLPADLGERSIDELSGGQMRRVAIAGLLASGRRILVLDEPLAGLDRESRRDLLEQLGQMRRDEGLTLVIVSHDFEDISLACDRRLEVVHGTLAMPDPPGAALDLAEASRTRSTHVQKRSLVLRAVPGTSPLHRLTPTPKLLALAGATLLGLALPGWPTVAALTALLALGTLLARLPRTVIPRLPWWALLTVAFGALLTAVGSGLDPFVRSLVLAFEFAALSLLTIWTTRVEDLPAAFVRITGPLRVLRAPVDEWAHTLALAVRTLPLLREEARVLLAGHRLRAQPHCGGQLARLRGQVRTVLDLTVALVASAARRSSDLGRASTLRGGMRPVGRRSRLKITSDHMRRQ
jgi:energy-coupling factor transporter ATP-binding protein EcfA2